jgi:hypothetical protein
MILAAVEGGQLIFLVVMAIFGLISWISGKLNPADKSPPQSPSSPGSPRRPGADPEDERMRRFLEALGVPVDEKPAPPRPRGEHRPVPPIVAPPPFPKLSKPRPRPAATPPPIEPRWQPSSLDELPAPTSRVEQIALPELAARSVPEFQTLSSKISAIPSDFPSPQEHADRPHGSSLSETLRAALASPQQLRSAFILSEVFGTPPGLRRS